MIGGAVGSRQPTLDLLPTNHACLSGGCADRSETPPNANALHEQARKAQETLKRLLKEINELLDKTRDKDQPAQPKVGSHE